MLRPQNRSAMQRRALFARLKAKLGGPRQTRLFTMKKYKGPSRDEILQKRHQALEFRNWAQRRAQSFRGIPERYTWNTQEQAKPQQMRFRFKRG